MGAKAGAAFNARRWQMAATHEHNIHTGVNRVLESVKSPPCLACLYRLIIPRLSRADTLNPTCQTPMWPDSRRMSRESLTVGFLLLFKEPPLPEPRVWPYLRFVPVDVCASLYSVSNVRFELSLLDCDRSEVSRWWIKLRYLDRIYTTRVS